MPKNPQSQSDIRPLKRFWRRLTKPPASVIEPDRRRLSRLLSTALILMSAFMITALLVMQVVPQAQLYSGGGDLLTGGTTLVLMLVSYALNRAGHYTPAALLAVVAPQASVYGGTILVWTGRAPYYDVGDVNLLVYTVVPILFASMLVSLQALLALILLNAGTMILIQSFFDHIALADIILGPLLYASAVSILVLLVTRQRDELEADRQAQLNEQKEQYRSLFDRMPMGLYRTTPDGTILDANRALVRLLGFPSQRALLETSMADLYVDPGEREIELNILGHGGSIHNFEIRLRRWNGDLIWLEDTCRTVRGEDRELICYEGGLENVTRRREIEEALRESEERFRSIFENAPIGIYRTMPDGRITMANATLMEMLGYDSLAVLNQPDLGREAFHPDYACSEFKRRMEREGRVTGLESAWKREDGTTVFVRESARTVQDHDGNALYYEGTVEDVTERKEMQRRLRRQDRLAAVGQMAGGIAHDFRNFLTSIILYAQMPLRNQGVGSDTRKAMETVVNEAKQAASLVQQILDFSRRSVMATEVIDLSELIEDVTEMLRKTIPETIDVGLHGTSHPCPVEADPTRIQQVLMNLALNARDAMPEGGELGIRLDRTRIGSGDEPVPEMEPGEWTCLEVSDTGVGMTDEVRDHLFEPFFTTKGPGEGTGLGLAQVYGIVKQHQGFIDVESDPSRGSTFRIYLPAAAVDEVPVSEKSPAPARGQGETILLAEDEATVRHATKRVLESLGYRVVTAVDGREAEELAGSIHFDLLLTDLVMPTKGGRALIESLQASRPDLKAIAFTGYAVDDLHDISVNVLQKPLDVETLAQAVRQALDAA